MTTDRQTFPISAVVAEFYDGPHATPPPADNGPIFLGIKNMTEDGHLDLSEIRHISESDYARWTRRVEPRPGDIVFTYEASLHRYAILPEGFRGCLGRRVALLRPDPHVADTKYLLYVFIGPEWRRTVQARLNIGATVDRLPLGDLPNFPIRLPPLDIQRKVASVLSAYDELIENNHRRIRLLEEMTRRIFREWFVECRYPGHGDKSGLGGGRPDVCASWRERDLCELGTITMGQSPPSSAYNTTGDGLPFHQGVGTFGEHFPVLTKYSRVGDRIAEPGDVLLSVRAPVGRINVADCKLILGRGLCGVRGDEAPTLFLLYALKHVFQEEDSMGGGSIFNAVTKKDVEGIPILWPGRELVQAFADRAGDTNALIANLTGANSVLRDSRELLLPRLISGELDVANLDISGVEVAA